jgi:regulatory protein RepA
VKAKVRPRHPSYVQASDEEELREASLPEYLEKELQTIRTQLAPNFKGDELERVAWLRLASTKHRTLAQIEGIFQVWPTLRQWLKETNPTLDTDLSSLLQDSHKGGSDDFSWLCFEPVESLPDKDAKVVIEGLLRIGEKLGITAGSKRFKSWLLLYIAYCVANGLPFLDFATTKAKVIVFDLELSRRALKRRLLRIQKALGEGDFENLKVCSLRGKAKFFCTNLDEVKKRIREQEFEVVIIDPVYKFLLGKEENSNGLVAEVLEDLTTFCMEAAVAIVYVHHHSKGNQSGKESLDRASGAGAWSRDPDAILDLTEHQVSNEEQRVFVAEITVRDFPPIEKFVVHWNPPILIRDEDGLDPEELKQPKKAGRPPGDTEDKILVALRTAECVAKLPGLAVAQIQTVTGCSKRTIYAWLKKMTPSRIMRCIPIKGYQLSLAERQRFTNNSSDDDNGSEP